MLMKKMFSDAVIVILCFVRFQIKQQRHHFINDHCVSFFSRIDIDTDLQNLNKTMKVIAL